MVKMDETAKYVLIYCQAKQQRKQLFMQYKLSAERYRYMDRNIDIALDMDMDTHTYIHIIFNMNNYPEKGT